MHSASQELGDRFLQSATLHCMLTHQLVCANYIIYYITAKKSIIEKGTSDLAPGKENSEMHDSGYFHQISSGPHEIRFVFLGIHPSNGMERIEIQFYLYIQTLNFTREVVGNLV